MISNTRLVQQFSRPLIGIVACLYAIFTGASESSLATLDNLHQPFDLAPYIEYIEDVDHSITEEDIRAGKFNHRWLPNVERFFAGPNLKSKYWFRFTVMWRGDHDGSGILAIHYPPGLLFQVTLFIPTGTNSHRTEKAGFLEPYSKRELQAQHYGFSLDLKPHTPLQIIGFVDNSKTAAPIILPIYIVSEQSFQNENNRVVQILIAFYAIMGSLLLYNTCLFMMLRQPVYGLYVLFLLGVATICAILDGSASRLFFPDSPELNYRMSHIVQIFTGLVYLSFVVEALDKVKFWPRFIKLFHILLIVGIIGLIHAVFTEDTFLASIFMQVLSGIILTVALSLITSALYKGVATAGYLLVAEMMTVSGTTISLLMIHRIVPVSEFALWGMHWGWASEALLLSLAVAARTNIAIQEKLKAQELAYQNERKALAALESAAQTKNQFLTTVSHELRTPLNSIIGFSNVLLDNQQISGADRDHAQTILNNGKQLLSVVNDVLNLSLIDSNRLTIAPRVVDLFQLLQGLELKYRLMAQKSDLLFTVTVDQQLPQLIEIDDQHLTQILKQLLNNAFKFIHQGCVTLSATALGQPTNQNTKASLLLTLTDTGIGIPADKLAQIFEPFTQADSSNTRRYSGTGVGLFIAKSICEKMNGTLSVNSTVGVGTRIDLMLPAVIREFRAEQAPIEQHIKPTSLPERPTLRGRVLYAEDNLDNQQLVQLLVTLTGAEITLVENGKQAIEAIRNSEQPFDLVLMDLQMPVMDGYEAAAILKSNDCSAPIIACSASALAEMASSNVSFEGYLGKPIDKMQLYAVLTEFLVAV